MTEAAELSRETEALPCGCAPYTGIRCDAALVLWDAHARAWRAKGEAHNEFAREKTPAARERLVAAWKACEEAWQRYEDHLGVTRDVTLPTAFHLESRLIRFAGEAA